MVKECRKLLEPYGDPSSIKDYKTAGGFAGYAKASAMTNEGMLAEIKASGLLGRGGAGFPTWMKWDMVNKESDPEKYVVCNLDEGETGAFKDRELLVKAPMKIIEGMIIAGFFLDAKAGYIYLRGEYRAERSILLKALDECRNAGYIGAEDGFDIIVVTGAGSYLCGEETALLESVEGRRPETRKRPPYPTSSGLFGKPSLINNAETYANIPRIFAEGAKEYSEHITKLICISGQVKNKGVFEAELGSVTLHDLIYDEAFGGGTLSGKPAAFYQMGGGGAALGFSEQVYTPLSYDAMREAGLGIGCGALIVADNGADAVKYLKNVVEFFERESCGRCIACRDGLPQLKYMLEELRDGKHTVGLTDKISSLSKSIAALAGCGLGTAACSALNSYLKYRRDDLVLLEKEGAWYE